MKHSSVRSPSLLLSVLSLTAACPAITAAVQPVVSAPSLPLVDLSRNTARQVVVAQGTAEVYQGHPTTLLLPDGKTMFCVWTLGHGGACGPMKRSEDGGLAWSELLPVPENWKTVRNCPSLYRLTDPQGVARLFVFAGQGPGGTRQPDNGTMQAAHSEDNGRTWSEMRPLGLQCVMPFCTIVPVDGGKKLLGLTNIRRPGETQDKVSNIIAQSESTDGGLTWSPWRIILDLNPLRVCEPALVRSPDGKQLLCLLRENLKHVALYITSDDEGRTWSAAKPLPAGLHGDRHMPHYAPDGRLVVCFRDTGRSSSTKNHFVGWVGRYDDILHGRDGQYRIKLLHSYHGGDCGYPGLELLPDGTFVATTYIQYRPGKERNSVVSTRFKLEETDALAAGPLTNSIGMKLVRIEPGAFVMGQDGPPADYVMSKHPAKFDDADWDERPVHKVTISAAFHLSATEVTVAQYRRFQPEHRQTCNAGDDAVTDVSWNEAVKFCDWLSAREKRSYRLPTEAEWEYACRAGTTTLFNTGDRLPDGSHKWLTDTGYRNRFFPNGKLPQEFRSGRLGPGALRVAQTQANAWGLFDLHGNVAEWCADWYGPYEAAAQTDPLGRGDGNFRVIRGGSHSTFTRLLRSANRSGWLPEARNERTGFRVVLGELPHGATLPPAAPPLNARDVRQGMAKIEAPPAEVPFFSGPKPFVKIPPNSAGPLYSRHNHSPAITECPNGDLLAVWYSCVDEAGTELCNIASRLRLGATDWEPASPFWDGPDVNDHAPKLWWDGRQTLYHFARGWFENVVRTSTDNGATWSKARIVEPHGEFGNQLIRLKDGTLVISHDSRQVSLVFSKDGGQTWAFNDVAHRDSDFRPGGSGVRYPGIHAPIVQLADGRIMAISRNDKPEDQAKFDFKTPISFTSDLGRTWTYAASEFPALSSVQRPVLLRLREGPLLLCSFTDQWRDWKKRKGMKFKAAAGTEFTGYGLFAALSFDEGKTWPLRRLVTPGGAPCQVNGIDRVEFTLSDTMAEPCGYLAGIQTRDGRVQLITSKNHYVFNLPWLKGLPPAPAK